ncbi:hypothetical protein DFH09DRAFT_1327121 [Mycena vulgaris]|nr:hypothetical protein DFH09DRAFT_1327121 [Mycena vulgaris]
MLRLHGELSPPRDPAFAALVLRDVPLLRARLTPATRVRPCLGCKNPASALGREGRTRAHRLLLLPPSRHSIPALLRSPPSSSLPAPPSSFPPPAPAPLPSFRARLILVLTSEAPPSRVLLPALLPSPGLLASSHSSISCFVNAGVWGTDDERCSKERSQRQRSRPVVIFRKPAPASHRARPRILLAHAPPALDPAHHLVEEVGRQHPPVRWRSLFASSRLFPPPSSPHPEHHIIEGEVGTPACASCPHRASHRASQEPTHVVQSCAVEVESEVEFSSKERCPRAPSPPSTSASKTTPVVSSPPLPSLARATQHIP